MNTIYGIIILSIIVICVICVIYFNKIANILNIIKYKDAQYANLSDVYIETAEDKNIYHNDMMTILDITKNLNLSSNDEEYSYEDIKTLLRVIEYIDNSYTD